MANVGKVKQLIGAVINVQIDGTLPLRRFVAHEGGVYTTPEMMFKKIKC